MIDKAIAMPPDEKRDEFVTVIGAFMKMAQNTYNREGVSDEHIRNDLSTLSNGKLVLNEKIKIKDILAAKHTQVPPSIAKNTQKNQVKNSIDKEKQEQAKKMLSQNKQQENKSKQEQQKQPQQQKAATAQNTIKPTVAQTVVTPPLQVNTPETPTKKRRRGGVKHKKANRDV
jgi:septal ring factor EnvC (AmiA/AmiB activator)